MSRKIITPKKGEVYRLKYYVMSGINSIPQEVVGNYEMIKWRGAKIHFFDNECGIDKMMSKNDFNKSLIK